MTIKKDSGKDVMLEELGLRDGSMVYVKDLGENKPFLCFQYSGTATANEQLYSLQVPKLAGALSS